MEKTDKKDFLWYGLYAFAGFGLELVLQMLEGMLGLENGVWSILALSAFGAYKPSVGVNEPAFISK